MKSVSLISCMLISLIAFPLQAEKPDHFAALASPDVATAFCNLAQFNEKLSAITKKPMLDAEDMVSIHELTYTLENAVIRLKETIEEAQVKLEEVHLASEDLNQSIIQKSSKQYMTAINSLTQQNQCN